MIKELLVFARNWGLACLHPRPLVGLFQLPRFFLHGFRYSKLPGAQPLKLMTLQPCLGDWTATTPFDPHYFYQGAWLARRIRGANSSRHVDVGSSVLTMSVLSAHVPTTFVDYRPLDVSLPGLTSVAGDVLALPFADGSLASLSCLHVIEHIGLGRYGDTLDPLGSIKAARELQRVLARDGSLYLSLPVGRERVCFNAHRVHLPKTVVGMFPQLELIEFSYVDDGGRLIERAVIEEAANLDYGCGLFHFRKLSVSM